MQLVNFKAGDRFSAANLNLMQNQFGAYKLADESVTSSTTLQNDNDLIIPASMLAPNGLYVLDLTLVYQGGTQGASDLKCQWLAYTGVLINLTYSAINTSGASGTGSWNYPGGNPAFGTAGGSTLRAVTATGTMQLPASGLAAVTLQWAQNTSSTTATVTKEGSSLLITRIQ
jgi:hypothetical protein